MSTRSETLIVTGDADLLVPGENSKLLADRIPRSRLETFPGCGHGLIVQAADQLNATLLDFLDGPA